MSYRCKVCDQPAPPGQSRLVHVVYRELPAPTRLDQAHTRREIAAEIPVCPRCHAALAEGKTLAQLRKRPPVNRVTAPDRSAEARRGETLMEIG